MSGELQTVPARHGVATFVPRGRTIKIINTYGKQVVAMWAFTLGAPPEEGEEEMEEEMEAGVKEMQAEQEEAAKQGSDQKDKDQTGEQGKDEERKDDREDPPEQAPDTSNEETESTEKSTESEKSTGTDKPTESEKSTGTDRPTESEKSTGTDKPTQPPKRPWSSYLPSLPYRTKGKSPQEASSAGPTSEEQTAQNEANTKKWSSYLPTGKGFSSYIPSVEVPSKEGVVSAFKATHPRDPNKSYAEQLYDFSKTPVGAGTIAAATGSGYASSVYAAYTAYTQSHPSSASRPQMEYLSLPHTRAETHTLVPAVNDTLLTNLRNPILTLIEDTSPGAHDTLTAACDAHYYASVRGTDALDHGSCAENLVLALRQLNGTAGLKGARAIGADVSVNIAPTPLHLFMLAPVELDPGVEPREAGAKGARMRVLTPAGGKRAFVRFRAERDVVVVLSACPDEVGEGNGGRCMAANFVVEGEVEGVEKEEKEKPAEKLAVQPAEQPAEHPSPENKASASPAQSMEPPPSPATADEPSPKPKKKPKKLEVRSKA